VLGEPGVLGKTVALAEIVALVEFAELADLVERQRRGFAMAETYWVSAQQPREPIQFPQESTPQSAADPESRRAASPARQRPAVRTRSWLRAEKPLTKKRNANPIPLGSELGRETSFLKYKAGSGPKIPLAPSSIGVDVYYAVHVASDAVVVLEEKFVVFEIVVVLGR
jgi:hypothetical protein